MDSNNAEQPKDDCLDPASEPEYERKKTDEQNGKNGANWQAFHDVFP